MELTLTLPPTLVLGVIVSTILPLIVGLVTKTVTNSALKAVLLALLAAALGLLTELLAAVQAGRTYDLGIGLLVALTGFLVAVGMHFGIWKPTGLSEAAQRVGSPPIDAGTASDSPSTVTSLGSSLELGEKDGRGRHEA